jgi:purine-nucleoside phosphorylase
MSDETKQTAVEWYDNQLRKVFSNTTEESNFSHEELLQQALEMEKEQIKSAFNIGELMAHDYFYGNDECAENYYNETYGGNK